MRLGPIHRATLIVQQLERSLAAYAGCLGQRLLAQGALPKQRALDLGEAGLDGARRALLAAGSDEEPWLELIEAPGAAAGSAMAERGWLGLILPVRSVEAYAEGLAEPFTLRPENAIELPSAAGRSLGLLGPDGEWLLLIESGEDAADCGLPPARCAVDRCAGALLGVSDARATPAFHAGLGLLDDADEDARPNTPFGMRPPFPLGRLRGDHWLAFLPLPGLPAATRPWRCGLRLLSLKRSDHRGRPLAGHRDPSARILAGPEGEAVELV